MEPYQEIESKYAAFTGASHAVSCSSGTAALHLALLALGVGKGDEVIVPDFTMAACAFAVSYCSAKPVFVDVTRGTYAIDPVLIERAITKKTKAILVVHVYGRLADMDAILKIAAKHRVPVIEDACEAQGAVYKSKAAVTAYSFYRNKIIPAEEGGMITTNDKRVADKARYLKSMAFGANHDYFHEEIGYNYRMPNAEAKIALANLKAYPKNNDKRRLIESWYNRFLKAPMSLREAVWFYELRVPSSAKKAILEKIPEARHSFKPLSSFPMYGSGKGKQIARELSQELILLPAHPSLSKSDVKRIADVVNPYI